MSRLWTACLLTFTASGLAACGAPTEDEPPAEELCLLPECTCTPENRGFTYAFPEEVGHWAAGHIDLPVTPFEVTEVLLTLAGPTAGSRTESCSFDIGTTVQIFLSDSATPPATPEVLWQQDLPPGGDPEAAMRDLTLDVEPSVVVMPGEHLFVAIQMPRNGESALCILACRNLTTEVSDATWWSNAVDPEFPWVNFTELGGEGFGYDFRVRGRVLQD